VYISIGFFNFLVLFYFITFTPKWFVLSVAAVSAVLRVILLYKMCKVYNFRGALLILHTTGQFCAHSILTSLQWSLAYTLTGRYDIIDKSINFGNCICSLGMVLKICP